MNGEWLPPFGGITERQRWTRVLACAAVLVVTGYLMTRRWPESPGSIIDFELAGDDAAREYIYAWNTDEQRVAGQVIVVDFAFLVAYGLGGALLLDGVARWSASWHEGWSRVLARCAWLPIVAAAFDLVENVALLAVTADRTETWPDLAKAMARTKFALLDAFYAATLVALVSAAFARVRRREPRTAITG